MDSDDIRCLFVTRADTAAGLESVRFVEPQVFPLERPQTNIVRELLSNLAETGEDGEAIILHPNHGWERLKGRVERDLEGVDVLLAADGESLGHVMPRGAAVVRASRARR